MPTTSPTGPRLCTGAIQSPYPSIGTVHLEAQVVDAAAELPQSHPPPPIEELPEMGGLEVDKMVLEVQLLERVARPWWKRPSVKW